MSSTLPAVAIGLGLAYYTLQTSNEGKKKRKEQVEEMINRRVAVDTIEKERETKRDPEVKTFTDTPAKSGMGFGYYKSGETLSKMIADSGFPFDFGATRLIGSGEKQEMEKPSDAEATKFIKAKNELEDGTEARRQAGQPQNDLDKQIQAEKQEKEQKSSVYERATRFFDRAD